MRIGGQMPRGNSWGVKFSLRNCCVGSCYGNSANRRPARATGWRMRICFCTYQTCAVTGWTTGMSRSSSTGTTSTPRQAPEPSRWVPIVQPLPFDLASPHSGQAFRLRFAALRSAWGSLRSKRSSRSTAALRLSRGPVRSRRSNRSKRSSRYRAEAVQDSREDKLGGTFARLKRSQMPKKQGPLPKATAPRPAA